MLNTILGIVLSVASKLDVRQEFHLERATHYGKRFEGRKMANGHTYLGEKLSAASNQYPLGTVVRVVNPLTGRGIYVTIEDRTSKTKHGRPVFDLSEAAFDALGLSRTKGWGWVSVREVEEGK